MPTYQYQCADCGEALEIHQSFSDASLTECPACGGSLRKVFNAVGVVFKGSGFYRTDSRSKDTNGSSSSTSATPAADSSSTSTPKESSSSTSSSSTSSSSSSSD